MHDADTLLFFDAHPGALPLYTAFLDAVRALVPDVRVKVCKTQISLYARRLFACVSFTPVRRAADRPRDYITVTFGLPEQVDSPRIDAVCQPSPHRWTHHVLVARPEEIDGELMNWIRQAAEFAGRGTRVHAF